MNPETMYDYQFDFNCPAVTNIHPGIDPYAHECIHTFITCHACIHTYKQTNIQTYIHRHIHIHTYYNMSCVYTHIQTNIQTYIDTYTYIHTTTFINKNIHT